MIEVTNYPTIYVFDLPDGLPHDFINWFECRNDSYQAFRLEIGTEAYGDEEYLKFTNAVSKFIVENTNLEYGQNILIHISW